MKLSCTDLSHRSRGLYLGHQTDSRQPLLDLPNALNSSEKKVSILPCLVSSFFVHNCQLSSSSCNRTTCIVTGSLRKHFPSSAGTLTADVFYMAEQESSFRYKLKCAQCELQRPCTQRALPPFFAQVGASEWIILCVGSKQTEICSSSLNSQFMASTVKYSEC